MRNRHDPPTVAELANTVAIAATVVLILNGVDDDLFGSEPRASRGTSSTGSRSMNTNDPDADDDAVALAVAANKSVLASGSSRKQYPPILEMMYRSHPSIGPRI